MNLICKIFGHRKNVITMDAFSPLIFREICICKTCGRVIYDFTFWPHHPDQYDILVKKFNQV